MKRLKVLIACEESQAVCNEFRRLGHEAYSCDLLPCSGGHPEYHLHQDVIPLLKEHWDLIIAFPPCTHLACSGAPSFAKKREDGRQKEGIEFFANFLNLECEHVAIENPIGIISGDYIRTYFSDLCEKYDLPRKYDQVISPWNFGDNFEKHTCLWLKGLPKLTLEVIEQPELQYYEYVNKKTGKKNRQPLWYYEAFKTAKNNAERSIIRSKTFPGIARAMAEQWSKYLTEGGETNET